jgi:hypothetical protein
MRGNERMALLILNLRFGWGSVQLHAPAALPPGKEHGYPLTRRLIGPQIQLGRFIKEKHFPCRRSNHDLSVARSVLYRIADKSLARPGREQATSTEDFGIHISYL